MLEPVVTAQYGAQKKNNTSAPSHILLPLWLISYLQCSRLSVITGLHLAAINANSQEHNRSPLRLGNLSTVGVCCRPAEALEQTGGPWEACSVHWEAFRAPQRTAESPGRPLASARVHCRALGGLWVPWESPKGPRAHQQVLDCTGSPWEPLGLTGMPLGLSRVQWGAL